jgi:hypothetical protein
MKKWKHKVLKLRIPGDGDDGDMRIAERALNSYGKKGWEIVGVSPSSASAYILVFMKMEVSMT